MINRKLIYYFLKNKEMHSLRYPMKDDCIRIFEYSNQKGIIHIFKGMENLMDRICVINLEEKRINISLYLSKNKNIRHVVNLFLFNQIIKGGE